MKKTLQVLFILLMTFSGFSQTQWSRVSNENVTPNKNVLRQSFPKNYVLYNVSFESLNQTLQNAPNRLLASSTSTIISIPNLNGELERFEIFEFSNFAPELQAQFPQIRSYVGKGLDDKLATIRLSSDPSGIQSMIFRVGKRNEFMEPYSEDKTVYAVYESQRIKGALPFTCSTDDVKIANDVTKDLSLSNRSSNPELLNFRLALSCNGEYTTYFGGTVAGALAAMNATMTRVNGVCEKDLAIHMNIIANNTNVIFTNATSDPYTTMGSWNGQLQSTLTSVIGEANYDIGHMFGASGGGGNAGCIGCVCVDGQKGSGITSPADGIPMGDTFDIDYVVHEMGHQFGGNHSFSHNVEGSGVNVEPGSGSTIMGYAGITSQDVQPHSDDYFVYANVKQIQDNMVGKTCPTRTSLTHGAPVVNAGSDYTIPKSTPFILSGSATDSNGDTLSYCWEQNDTATTQTGANSAASATKTGGPNWRSYSPVATPVRYCPPLARVVNNQSTTQGAEIVVEALSSVARNLNFVLTARDSYAGAGLTGSDAMVVTVNATAGPFLVSSPNTNVNWPVGTTQDITWDVAGTTANGVNATTVDILLSTDGGFTYPITLATNVTNDGLEPVVIPNNIGTTNRVMVRGHNHIFYDISNTNFTISEPLTDFTIAAIDGLSFQSCTGIDALKEIQYTTYAGFNASTTLTVSGQPAGSTVTFSPNPISTTGIILMTVSNTSSATPGSYSIVVTATSGSIVKTLTFAFQLFNSSFAASSLTSPANMATSQSNNINLNWVADSNATSYDVQVSTVSDFSTIYTSGNVLTNTYALSGLANLTSYYWRIKPKNQTCEGVYSAAYMFTTGNVFCNTFASTNIPLAISTSGTPTVNSTLTIPAVNNVVINDVNVTVNITHTWVADLTVSLISPNNTTVNLVVTQCTNNDNINATFDDAGTTLVCATNPAIAGTIIPTQPLAAFNGFDSQGLWTLRVADGANLDGGTINSWSLDICGIQTLSTLSNTIQNFSLYPNPNSGNFNVQFNSNSTKDISVNVYDMRGRSVYANSYKNNGLFNESIQLSNVQSGIYLVSINDGENKITKKIVIE